ncbi:MAG: hypothetical protein AMJ73_10115 [candidate division Zixibacteria bacterium SM1_73]|nr:MAG: hypothetical protein AMJ73_10115 [candidate division Zixibacteria bacterium SM1_73]
MGLIVDGDKLKKKLEEGELDQTSWDDTICHLNKEELLNAIVDCQADILSPAEIERGIEWFEKYKKINLQLTGTEITDLLRMILKQPQKEKRHPWNPEIFKEEKKHDAQNTEG